MKQSCQNILAHITIATEIEGPIISYDNEFQEVMFLASDNYSFTIDKIIFCNFKNEIGENRSGVFFKKIPTTY